MATSEPRHTDGSRLLYADVRPYTVATALTDLDGPTFGKVELPSWIAWGPRRVYDLADCADQCRLYEIVLHEAADPTELATFVNGALLRELWPDLWLPRQLRERWEATFPELAHR